jgi:hypothetical protein
MRRYGMSGLMKERSKGKKTEEAPRSNRARAVADMLPAVGGAAFRRFGFVQSSIVSRWREIVGDRYAEVATPESIRFPVGKKSEGVLSLSVDGAHAAMLQHVAPAIMERVNRFFGYPAVAKVVMRQNVAAIVRRPRAAPPSLRPIPQELGTSLRSIADPELRDVLTALAGAVEASTGTPRFDKN